MEVANKHYHKPTPNDVYVARGSALGNPFSHRPGTKALYLVETREEAIKQYEVWLRGRIAAGDQAVLAALDALNEDNILVCFCTPAACHAEVIIKIWHERKHERERLADAA